MIRLYCSDVSRFADDALFEKQYAELSAARREKIDRMCRREDRNLSLGAGMLIDRGLGAFGLREADMTYGVNDNGKPFFVDHPEIRFNVSHSGTAVVAVFSDREVGCDVEQIGDTGLDVAERFFCPDEYDAITALQEEDARRQLFYRYWVLKESVLKATGLGMSLPMNSFEIRISERGPELAAPVDGARWRLVEFDSFPGYRSALCIRM